MPAPKRTRSSLLLPCAGKSSRYPGMPPKWMLPTPDGKIVIEKAVMSVDTDCFDRILVAIRQDHDQKYQAAALVTRVFGRRAEVLTIVGDTRGPADTVARMIAHFGIRGPISIKDSDTFFRTLKTSADSFVAACDLRGQADMARVASKSFLQINEQGNIVRIVEKQVCSNFVSAGLYGISSGALYLGIFNNLVAQAEEQTELFVSHVLSAAITQGELVRPCFVQDFVDIGTIADWRTYCRNNGTVYVPVDGVLVQSGQLYESAPEGIVMLPGNVEFVRALQKKGAQIILVSQRPKAARQRVARIARQCGIRPHAIIMECRSSIQTLVNDYSPDAFHPVADAIEFPRDSDRLRHHFEFD